MTQAQMEINTIPAERKTSASYVEFIVILSMMMSLTALSIDAMLPALPVIDDDLGIGNPNSRQLIVSLIFFGSAVGQLFFGPLSDKIGRKPAIYVGYALYTVGSLTAMASINFPMILVGRLFQGLGVSAPRAVTTAIVRDRYEGRLMARVMSFTMTVFILVPMIAPTIGQGILSLAGWRSIFGSFLVFALVSTTWFALRIPESLPPERRVPFSLKRLIASVREILNMRPALGYTLTVGLVQGIFLGYLFSAQQIFQDQYDLGNKFLLYFAIVSLALGLASFLNARLVMRYGMITLVYRALGAVFGLAVIFLGVASALSGHPPLWLLMAYLMLSFFCTGILFGNLNSLAMDPLGHLAGIGAAVVGSFSTLLAMALGTVIGQIYNGTILPLVVGMVVLSGIANLVIRWVGQPEPEHDQETD